MGHQLQKYKDDYFLLLESGYIAANHADEDAALKLFKASSLLDPENSLSKVGLGYVHLLKLELKQAISIFQGVLEHEPHNYMAQSMLGLAHALTTKEVEKGEKLLQEALKKTDEESVKNMATTAIEFIEKFVKKAPTPAQGQTNKDGQPKKKEGKKK